VSRWQLLPALTIDELDSLRSDIAAHGVLDPVELDDEGEIIDGHHRAMIADSLGISYPTVTRSGWSDDDIVEHVFRKHLGRRNLTTEQRHEVVREMRRRLRWSNVRIATALGVDEATVRRDLQRISADAEMPAVVETADGRVYPASTGPRPRPAPMPDALDAALAAIEASPEVREADARARWAALLAASARFVNEGRPEYWRDRLTAADRERLAIHLRLLRRYVDEWETVLAGPAIRLVSGGPA